MKYSFRSVILLIFSSLLTHGLFASEDLFFSGYLEDSRYLNMYLQVNENRISGWFRFNDDGTQRNLSGSTRFPDPQWTLYEVDEQGAKLNSFEGEMEGGIFSGIFEDQINRQTFELQLRMRPSQLVFSMGGDRVHTSVQFPLFSDFLNQQELNHRVYQHAVQQADQFFSMFLDITDFSLSEGMVYQTKMTPVFFTDHWISMIFDSYQFSGGAHGNTFLESRCYHYDGGRWTEVTLEDLTSRGKDSRREIIELILEDLRQQGAQWALEDEMISEATLLDDFTLGPVGITFHFDSYKVGPYSQGMFEVFLSWEQTAHLWEDYVLMELLARG